jgi:hypothetical protein
MTEARNWADPTAAQAALNDPRTATFDLLGICMAHSQLRASAALHPNADLNLLTWIAGQEEPVAAATASSRLAQLAPPPIGAPPPPMLPLAVGTGQTPAPRPAKPARIGLWAGVGVLTVALIVAAVIVVPRLLHTAVAEYAPELRELPGLVSVDAQQGLSTAGKTWSTTFYDAPEAGYVIGANATSAYADYQVQLSEYNDASAALKQWESDYASGYSAGKVCLADTDQGYYYETQAEYCFDYAGDYLSVNDSAAEAGFVDAVNGAASSPDHPGDSGYTPPQIPAKPTEPEADGNLVGIDLGSGTLAWRVELSSVWPDAQPRLETMEISGEQALLVLQDVSKGTEETSGPTLLAMLNVKTGVLGASASLPSDGSTVVTLHGNVAVVTDADGALRGLSTSDLTQKWTSTARPYWWQNDESPYWISQIPGDYLLTDDGYLRMTDGQRATFGRDAGQDSIQLGVLNGTADQLIRLQTVDTGYDVSGFDPNKDEQTWKLSGIYPTLWSAGGLIIASSEGEVEAYRLRGTELDRQWRYSCDSDCGLSFADDSRVFITQWQTGTVVVLNTADGEQLDTVTNNDGGSPMVGASVLYLRQDQRLIARDRNKSGLPTLWRSIPFEGALNQVGDRFVIEDQTDNVGKVGILGLDGDDWNDFRAKEG